MKVKFVPQDVEFEIKPNQSVMDVAHENNLPVRTVCNGNATCAECRVHVKEGEQNLAVPGMKELSLIGTGYFIDQRRLSCQLRCFGDVTIDLTEQLEKQKQAPKKVLGNRKMDLDKSHAVSEMLITQDEDIQKVSASSENKSRNSGRKRFNRNRNRK